MGNIENKAIIDPTIKFVPKKSLKGLKKKSFSIQKSKDINIIPEPIIFISKDLLLFTVLSISKR